MTLFEFMGCSPLGREAGKFGSVSRQLSIRFLLNLPFVPMEAAGRVEGNER